MTGRRGFSFVEVFLGLVLLTLAIFPLHGLMMAGHTGTENTLHQARASGLATSVLEIASGLPYDGLTQQAVDRIANQVAGSEKTYRVAAAVSEEQSCPVARMPGQDLSYKRVVVEVTWGRPGEKEGRSLAHRVWLALVKARCP